MNLREQLIVDLERARHGFGLLGAVPAAGPEMLSSPAAGSAAFLLPPQRLTSPVCGDEVTVEVLVSPRAGDSRIDRVRWSGHGCTVSQASASALAARVSGVDAHDFAALMARFDALVRAELASPEDESRDGTSALDQLDALSAATGLGPAVAFAGIGRLPLRADCALLAWRSVAQALVKAAA